MNEKLLSTSSAATKMNVKSKDLFKLLTSIGLLEETKSGYQIKNVELIKDGYVKYKYIGNNQVIYWTLKGFKFLKSIGKGIPKKDSSLALVDFNQYDFSFKVTQPSKSKYIVSVGLDKDTKISKKVSLARLVGLADFFNSAAQQLRNSLPNGTLTHLNQSDTKLYSMTKILKEIGSSYSVRSINEVLVFKKLGHFSNNTFIPADSLLKSGLMVKQFKAIKYKDDISYLTYFKYTEKGKDFITKLVKKLENMHYTTTPKINQE